ncbi:hypothetical protein RhiJN_16185 [Ceratobasidium sp. AG-Ba]|nr:hypothetical protein RhiJN_16185 [Ceratobasidium sp. AG-Ba]
MDGSAAEFIVLHVVGSSDFTSAQDWWVRLERDDSKDVAHISTNKKLIIKSGAERTKNIFFKNGIPFARVNAVLQSIRPGSDLATKYCSYYASVVLCELTFKVENDYLECRIEDLWEIWSVKRRSEQYVNQIQWFKGRPTEASDYVILNVSSEWDDYGLWVRWAQEGSIDSIELAGVSRNRRRLIKPNSIMIADIGFNKLKFVEFVRAVKRIETELKSEKQPSNGRKRSKIVSVIDTIADNTNPDYYWVEGNPKDFSISFSALTT